MDGQPAGTPLTPEPSGARRHAAWPPEAPAVDPGRMLADLSLLPTDSALQVLGSARTGLRSEEAEARLHRDGPNVLPHALQVSPLREFAAQLTHFFAAMLWVAAVLAFVGRMPQLGWAIIVVVVVNAAFSFAQEYRAERASRALAALLPAGVTVVRSGRKLEIPARDVVRGDVVVLLEGDRIPADGRVLESSSLKVDLSSLTGESEALERTAQECSTPPPDPVEAENLVFAGTHVVSGSAAAVVAATAGATRLGSITHLTTAVARRPTPLRLQLNRAVKVIAALAVGAGAVFFVASLVLGEPAREAFLLAVGVIVALVPEGLLPTLTLSLARSATRMARRGALVRHLEAVETLGSTTVICTDKTGTLTANQMTAATVYSGGRRYHTTGTGYDPAGTILAEERPLSTAELHGLRHLLRAAALCGDARVDRSGGHWRCVGDSTEGALLVLARKGGVERAAAERAAHRVREFPFESQRRRMTTLHRLSTGDLLVLTKGSPEVILPLCTAVRMTEGTVPLTPARSAAVVAEVEAIASGGERVLALSQRRIGGPEPGTPDEAEHDLELLGLVGLHDPLRPEVPEAVASCGRAGIRVIMVTGDHPATARAVARQAGLPSDTALVGSELPASDEMLAVRLADAGVAVIARVAPEQKLRIAAALQAHGHVVAMTGDGVNDAPALRRADIGVAMGASGTDVAREAADLVLLDDNFAHIVEAVEEGRAAFDNIRRFLTYHLTDNVAELTPFVVWALSGGRFPLVLTVLQVLALDIGTDLLPALALGAEAPEPGALTRPPRSRTARLLDRRVLGRAFGFLGPVEAACSLAMVPLGAWTLFGWRPGTALPAAGAALATLSTMVFASIVAMQMANAFECRANPASVRSVGVLSNRLLLGAVATEAAMLAAFVYLTPVARILGQRSLEVRAWLPVFVTPFVLVALEEARKAVVRRHRAHMLRGAVDAADSRRDRPLARRNGATAGGRPG